MRNVSRFMLATLCLASFSMLASAAAPKDAELLDDIPSPPKVIEGQPIDQPTISKRKDGDNEVEEYSLNGEVYMVKVTPPSGKSYYLHREDRNGEWVHDGPSRPVSVPKWILFRF
ncbi:DUF2782 domain-containing protein [Methylophilus glucosoxydans]|uniref:DUF2782 domain-containing protein n=1 Tax=Methylophilus glucosoxydans TaxID=752553 RepID=A0ABW3GHP8_9PROT|nr:MULTISPECIES: DUF2782 domain-containing protein [unclassified Methylophilus]MBF5039605.1 DUF2782 domain-containing protein [Methylophilus sp. 13]MDT7849023.1 DUF2782 domain-containing protein [Methylophilus sp. VKM B-3414]BEV09031.1 DUF2782 domain-containing protein [Methylophilus sp. DW102]